MELNQFVAESAETVAEMFEATAPVEEPVSTTTASNTPSTGKKRRRGVNNETRSASTLKFSPKDATRDGLFVAQVEEVNVSWATINNTGGLTGEFAGHSIPKLNVHFTSLHTNANEKRHVYLSVDPIPSNVETIPNGEKAYFVDGSLGWIKYLLDTFYLNGRNLTEEEEDALTLPYEDYVELGDGTFEYQPVEVDTVIDGWKTVFEGAAAMLNGSFGENATNRPVFKNVNGKSTVCYIKLIAAYRNRRKEWRNVNNNGDLAFPSFVGEGCIEVTSGNQPPKILKLNPATERLTPVAVEAPKVPTMPANIPGGMGGVMPTDGFYGAGNSSFDAGTVVEDMPF